MTDTTVQPVHDGFPDDIDKRPVQASEDRVRQIFAAEGAAGVAAHIDQMLAADAARVASHPGRPDPKRLRGHGWRAGSSAAEGRLQGDHRGCVRMTFICLYQGVPGDCQECGGFDPTGTGFCSHDCREIPALREAKHARELRERRDREDAFAAEVARLRAAGYSYEECDVMLAGMPT